ncbi:very short patch repair endonuclease [Mycobacteroides abscessus]|nr:very short patch repair endonuclease [Mycobacteroides abscessus]
MLSMTTDKTAASSSESARQSPFVDPVVSRRMSNTRGRDTGPEREVRARLHARGFRYRVNVRPVRELRRTADIVFRPTKVAVMIDGCFWHGCPEHYRPATIRSDFWQAKVRENTSRDSQTNLLLAEHGWLVLRYWEHEDPDAVVASIVTAVTTRRASLERGRSSTPPAGSLNAMTRLPRRHT